MGKHSIEKTKNKTTKILFTIFTIFLIVLLIGIIIITKTRHDTKNDAIISIKNSTTIEGEKLVFKSTSEKCRIMEYTFENNILKKVKIYQEFEDKETFEANKKTYETSNNITIISINEKKLSIEIEKKDFGSDKDLSYDQIENKYLVQIIGAYEKI